MSDKFTYDYSAPSKDERREIEDIRRRYGGEKSKEDKLTKLRNLDKRVKNLPVAASLSLGIGGTLIFGLGLTMVLEWKMLLFGVIVMLIGCVPAALANAAYNILLDKNKRKYSDEILRLSEELLNGDED